VVVVNAGVEDGDVCIRAFEPVRVGDVGTDLIDAVGAVGLGASRVVGLDVSNRREPFEPIDVGIRYRRSERIEGVLRLDCIEEVDHRPTLPGDVADVHPPCPHASTGGSRAARAEHRRPERRDDKFSS
jgi:hypothetical protein